MLELKDFCFEIPGGPQVEASGKISASEIFCVRGSSGSGKTTLLRALAGLKKNTSGQISIDGVDLTNAPPEKRRVGYLLQGPQLIPAMTVAENLLFVLEIRHPEWSLSLRMDRVREVLKRAHLEKLIDQPSTTLSGGEAQRIAFCRVLLSEASYFLLDEPFTGLDPVNTQFFRNWLKDELKLRQRPTVMVSHDASDAADLGAKVIEWPRSHDLKVSLRFS
jgi:ABC-type sulfate/molybdate transport systems ATPase subunit